MKYTLITAKGKVYCFFIKDMADMYATLYGGTVVTEQIMQEDIAVIE